MCDVFIQNLQSRQIFRDRKSISGRPGQGPAEDGVTVQGRGPSFCGDDGLVLGGADGPTFVTILKPLNCTT